MSKQSDAREIQGYKIKGPTCATCAGFECKQVPMAWGGNRETNLRCGIGGFAVKKMGWCRLWREKRA